MHTDTGENQREPFKKRAGETKVAFIQRVLDSVKAAESAHLDNNLIRMHSKVEQDRFVHQQGQLYWKLQACNHNDAWSGTTLFTSIPAEANSAEITSVYLRIACPGDWDAEHWKAAANILKTMPKLSTLEINIDAMDYVGLCILFDTVRHLKQQNPNLKITGHRYNDDQISMIRAWSAIANHRGSELNWEALDITDEDTFNQQKAARRAAFDAGIAALDARLTEDTGTDEDSDEDRSNQEQEVGRSGHQHRDGRSGATATFRINPLHVMYVATGIGIATAGTGLISALAGAEWAFIDLGNNIMLYQSLMLAGSSLAIISVLGIFIEKTRHEPKESAGIFGMVLGLFPKCCGSLVKYAIPVAIAFEGGIALTFGACSAKELAQLFANPDLVGSMVYTGLVCALTFIVAPVGYYILKYKTDWAGEQDTQLNVPGIVQYGVAGVLATVAGTMLPWVLDNTTLMADPASMAAGVLGVTAIVPVLGLLARGVAEAAQPERA